MQRALNFMPIEKAIAQSGVRVGANVAGRIHLTSYTIQGDVASAHFNADDIAFRYSLQGRCVDPGKL